MIWDNQRIIDWDMLEAAKVDLLKSDDDKAKPVRSEKMSRLKVVYLYKGKQGESLIAKKNLEAIQKQEEYIQQMPEWKQLCWAESISDSSCSKQAVVSAL